VKDDLLELLSKELKLLEDSTKICRKKICRDKAQKTQKNGERPSYNI